MQGSASNPAAPPSVRVDEAGRAFEERTYRWAGEVTAIVTVIAIGWADHLTGHDVSLVALYLVPVVAAAWWLGRRQALGVAIAASLAWVVADLRWHLELPMAVFLWNAGSRMVIFVAMGWLLSTLRIQRYSLVKANETLEELLHREAENARTDALTGLLNWRGFVEEMAKECRRSERTDELLAVAYVDLDNFKQINDEHGHSAGDEVLQEVARRIQRSIREIDTAARIGGDEFVILLTDVKGQDTRLVAERVLTRILEISDDIEIVPPSFGASIGIFLVEDPTGDVKDFVQKADAAMYEAKNSGKRQIVFFHEPQKATGS